MPPFPIRCGFGECVPRLGCDESRVLYARPTRLACPSRQNWAALTRSNAAIFRCPAAGGCAVLPSGAYLPMTKLLRTTRQVMGSGFFCEVGVKKEDIDFSGHVLASISCHAACSAHALLTGHCRFNFAAHWWRRDRPSGGSGALYSPLSHLESSNEDRRDGV